MAFAAGATPIALYERYRVDNGITATDLSLVAAPYFVFAVFTLLVLGRLSNHVGRKAISLAAILGCTVLCAVDGPASLLAGSALAGSCRGARLVRVRRLRRRYGSGAAPWLVSTITSAGATVGR